MTQTRSSANLRGFHLCLPALSFAAALAFSGGPLFAQDAPQGPIAPPPEHHVTRIGNVPEPEAPPDLPEAEIIQRFSKKEDDYLVTRMHYTYRKTIRIQEFGPDGQPAGEYVVVSQPQVDADGKVYERVVERPHSTLQHFFLRSEDLEGLQHVPPFPLTTPQLPKYNLKYLGKEQVDEVNCYIFQVKPRALDRQKAYFDGIVWVDAKYLEVVKTYGKWVTDLGEMRSIPNLPFSLFETYRENVEGKYWFPNYSRSDDTMDLKNGQQIPVRMVIKWTDFKPLAAAPPAAPSAAAPAASAPPAKP
ncbi:MAG TPA: hypothetical protein VE263_05200 [Candidatus Angelobacter sp.]|nr:hypothetical protein [Candidatus Angelobacter sp.]